MQTLSTITPREDLEVSVVCAFCTQTLTFSRKYGWVHPNGEVYDWSLDAQGEVRNKHRAKPAVKVIRTTVTPIPEE